MYSKMSIYALSANGAPTYSLVSLSDSRDSSAAVA